VSAIPRATVRLQMHAGFDFDAARKQVPYFARLGVSHLYLSPILTARAGSTHGYDVVDYGTVNPELGGEEGLRRLVADLRRAGLGLIVDIVPNHMAVGEHDNRYWLDLLEWGRDSRYASFFDIDWEVPDPALNGKVLAPFLGKPYGQALDDGELQLVFDPARGRLHCAYYDHQFPIAPKTYALLLRFGGDALAAFSQRFREAATLNRAARGNAFEDTALDFARTVKKDKACKAALKRLLAAFSPATPEGSDRLHRLLERQHYRLAWWRTANDEINWRRFFDVIQLAGLRIQENATFEIVHETTFRLYAEGLIDGVRIDHIDGLADPRHYGRKLRQRLRLLDRERPAEAPRGQAWIVVEKILTPGERLPLEWRVDGTTGYNFMNDVGALLHDPAGEATLGALWTEMSGRNDDFEIEEKRARRRIPQELLAADFNSCARALHAIARSTPETRDWTFASIRRVLTEVLVEFPVYRTYADIRGRSEADQALMDRVLAHAEPYVWPGDRGLLPLFDRWLGGEPPLDVDPPSARALRMKAIARFQQLTSPVAAKSVEDTAFYRHGRLLSRNEVGATPAQFSLSVEDFHAITSSRQQRYPNAMLATATHDHKRGEDTRARLFVLSTEAEMWAGWARRWHVLHEPLKPNIDGVRGPDAADETMLYQMLVGAWPLDLAPDDAAGLAAFRDRLWGWQEKAVRESKRRSGWIEPNAPYEAGCLQFLTRLLDPTQSAGFLQEVHGVVQRIAAAGALNGLVQTLVRNTAPGVPDLYQGCELWDFSLVDPDNRRPVDYALRAKMLASRRSDAKLLSGWHDGGVKQQLTARLLAARSASPALWAEGRYVPIDTSGAHAGQIVAFARIYRDEVLLVAAPRCAPALMAGDGSLGFAPEAWANTDLKLPRSLSNRSWQNLLSGARLAALGSRAAVDPLLRPWPLLVLHSTRN